MTPAETCAAKRRYHRRAEAESAATRFSRRNAYGHVSASTQQTLILQPTLLKDYTGTVQSRVGLLKSDDGDENLEGHSNLAAAINRSLQVPNYTATSSGAVVTIKAPLGMGAAATGSVLSLQAVNKVSAARLRMAIGVCKGFTGVSRSEIQRRGFNVRYLVQHQVRPSATARCPAPWRGRSPPRCPPATGCRRRAPPPP